MIDFAMCILALVFCKASTVGATSFVKLDPDKYILIKYIGTTYGNYINEESCAILCSETAECFGFIHISSQQRCRIGKEIITWDTNANNYTQWDGATLYVEKSGKSPKHSEM